MAQWFKDPALSLQGLWSLLWRGFDPWLGNVRMPRAQPKKKKGKEKPGEEKKTKQWRGVPKTDLSVRKAEPSTVRPKNVFPRHQGSTLLSSFNKMRFFFFSWRHKSCCHWLSCSCCLPQKCLLTKGLNLGAALLSSCSHRLGPVGAQWQCRPGLGPALLLASPYLS